MDQETATVSDGSTGTIILRQHRWIVHGVVKGAPAAIHELPINIKMKFIHVRPMGDTAALKSSS